MLADLHVHSRHSKHPSEWFLQHIGAQESYTDVEDVYALARAQGAQLVTLTDRNTIDGAAELAARHPGDCFVSTEATAYFPEDGCKVHILCYGITPAQFAAIQETRENVYNLRDYLRREGIACSVAHATAAVNGRLTVAHLEKLILLFDVFEVINGTRSRTCNDAWHQVLRRLTPETLATLQARHRLEPWSSDPWRKGFTGGSDDHAGIFAGATATHAEAATPAEFLDAIRSRRTAATGRHGNHKSLAYAIYKIASEYAKRKTSGGSPGLPGLLSSILFSENGIDLREWVFIKGLGLRRAARDRIFARFLESLLEITRRAQELGIDGQVDRAYDALSLLLDDLLAELAHDLERAVRGGQAPDVLQNLAASIPAAFLAAPLFSALRVLHRDANLHREVAAAFGLAPPEGDRRVLWFSDTVGDLNGVSVTLGEVAAAAGRLGRPLRIVGCLTEQERARGTSPAGLLELPCIYSVTPDFYNAHTVRFPSILRALDIAAAENPDRVVLSTPGPVGLLGLAAGHLLGVPCTGIYHTDFARQAEFITRDASIVALVESYTRWFFGRMDEVRVPTRAYIELLSDRGLDRRRMRLFRRGLDASFRTVDPQRLAAARAAWFNTAGPTILYAGRLGHEKNLDLLIDAFLRLGPTDPDARLVLAGDGPNRADYAARLADCPNAVFTGRLDRDDLRACYALADLFAFPSTTDTFGMAVLEAQVFGLPALVTNVGGPQEIVRPGTTGFVLPPDDSAVWTANLRRLVARRRSDPDDYARWRAEIAATAVSEHSWDRVIDDLVAHPPPGAAP